MKRDLPSHHTERREQSKQSEDMIPVKVGDEDVMYPGLIDPVLQETDLGPFSTIYQKKPLTCMKQMSGGESF
jgi:hypothetical protein